MTDHFWKEAAAENRTMNAKIETLAQEWRDTKEAKENNQHTNLQRLRNCKKILGDDTALFNTITGTKGLALKQLVLDMELGLPTRGSLGWAAAQAELTKLKNTEWRLDGLAKHFGFRSGLPIQTKELKPLFQELLDAMNAYWSGQRKTMTDENDQRLRDAWDSLAIAVKLYS